MLRFGVVGFCTGVAMMAALTGVTRAQDTPSPANGGQGAAATAPEATAPQEADPPDATEGGAAQPGAAAPADGEPPPLQELQAETARLRGELAALLRALAERRQAAEAARATGTPAASLEPRTVLDVFFASGRAELSPVDQNRLAGAAEVLRSLGVRRLQVVGFSDRKGSPEGNEALSLTRARSVARALAVAGFDEGQLEAMSSAQAGLPLPIPTAEGVAEPLNRRVRVLALVDPAFVGANAQAALTPRP